TDLRGGLRPTAGTPRGDTAECRGDSLDQPPRPIQSQPSPRPGPPCSGQRRTHLLLRFRADAPHRGQPPGLDRLTELSRCPDPQSFADIDRTLRGESEQPPEADELVAQRPLQPGE